MKEVKFPQYRRYLNQLNYFCIPDFDSFEEIRRMGSKWIIEKHQVKILPDRNHVHDLLFQYQEFAEVITVEEYELVRMEA
ncbi:hypothetical protein BH09BAC5_BH09BAC5_07420 [soil metagenome]